MAVKALWPNFHSFFFHSFFFHSRLRTRGGLKGGCYTKGLREERRGGEKGWGVGEGVNALQVEVFVPISVCFSTRVNESEIFRKKVSRVFGFFAFLPYICTVDETRRGF